MKRLPIAVVLLLGLLLMGGARRSSANDGIFPPAPAAKAAIDFDGRGFLIHGRRTPIISAGMEYARVPRALWRDRLQRLQRAGFNCVEVYTFWNWHEPKEGQFDFSGDHDLNAFLKLVHTMGMYAICRVGPYYCAEWDSGGYPVWLRFKPGVLVRQVNAPFEAAVDGFFGRLIPIVAANQINHGGAVILVQLENEHPAGWGTEIPNAYFAHLRDKALALGIQVPYFFSGLHHGSDPAGDHSWDSVGRTNPWMTTEFWSVWYDHYGPHPEDADTYERRTWKILAYGGNGYNYYMAHGGTNFGYTNDDEDAASYDYGASVGQTGDLRPIYYRVKRIAWFARSFPEILEDSVNADAAFAGVATEPSVRVTARRSPGGSIVFLDNPGKDAVKTQVKDAAGTAFPAAGPLTLRPGEILPVVEGAPLSPHITLALGATHILGVTAQGADTTLVVFGTPGDPGQLRLAAPADAKDRRRDRRVGAGGCRRIRPDADLPGGPPRRVPPDGGGRVRPHPGDERGAGRPHLVPAGGVRHGHRLRPGVHRRRRRGRRPPAPDDRAGPGRRRWPHALPLCRVHARPLLRAGGGRGRADPAAWGGHARRADAVRLGRTAGDRGGARLRRRGLAGHPRPAADGGGRRRERLRLVPGHRSGPRRRHLRARLPERRRPRHPVPGRRPRPRYERPSPVGRPGADARRPLRGDSDDALRA